MTLQGSGVLSNAGSCFLTLPGLQLYPALEGKMDFSGEGPVLFNPTHPAVTTQQEANLLQQMSFINASELDQLTSSISKHHIEADVNTPFHVHAVTQDQVRGSRGITIGLGAAAAILALFLTYYLTHSYLTALIMKCKRKPSTNDKTHETQVENLSTSYPNQAQEQEDLEPPPVRFTTYSHPELNLLNLIPKGPTRQQ
jgi:hypothetical protein